MTEEETGTRARILRAADEEFAARGYHATSVGRIAARVGVTKAAVLYHFPGKADILAALAEPLLRDLEAAMARAAAADPGAARRSAVEGMLDVWLTHRALLGVNLQDLALAAHGRVFARFKAAMLEANVLVAGPSPDFAGRVRAAQAIAMLSDPVVLFADAPAELLRAEILSGVRRLLGVPEGPGAWRCPEAAPGPGTAGPSAPGGTASAPARSAGHRRRGRPAVMDDEAVARARRWYAAGATAAEIAAELGVSRATVYRHLSPAPDK
ncbi:TetR family transcriptional regulator [Streptomyces sp. NBC_01216]|uniref:TetR family transcriptional regulator n=1 Tax=unclassified Streptomyces TaxID=2593676 RepID=UPI002E1421CB|nr:TetR family transcriptional regulator [Streptomyces sp. NBC_01216]